MPAVNPGTTNLAAWWAHDSGATATDSHGANTLTNVGVSDGAAKVGTAAGDYVSASSDHQYIATNAAVSLGGGSYSVHLWFYADSTTLGTLIGKTNEAGNLSEYLIRYNGSVIGEHNIPALKRISVASVSSGAWHHVVMTYDGSNLILYVDNVASAPLASTAPSANASDMTLGRLSTVGAAAQYFDGRLDEVALWNDKALSADEVEWLYNAGAGRSYADLSPGNPVAIIQQQHWRSVWAGGVPVG